MAGKIIRSLKYFGAAAILMAASAAHAASGGAFKVAIDQAKPLMLSAPAAGIVVGNPAIAAVSLQSDRLLFVTGRTYGTTNLVVVGANGRPIYESRITVTPDEGSSTVVMVTKGTATVRNECAPICRRTPDVADDAAVFDEVNKQATDHAASAQSASQ
jgi:Flp pilus assembly secretin CpaC